MKKCKKCGCFIGEKFHSCEQIWDKLRGKNHYNQKGKNNPMFGKKQSIESNIRRSNTLKKKRNGPLNPFYGKHHKEESKIKMHNKLFRDKSPNWKDGISKLPYDINFNDRLKNLIRKRDNHMCQICRLEQNKLFMKNRNGKIINKKLLIHHIDYNKENSKINNLISLCSKCHGKIKTYDNYWYNYFKGIMK